MDSTETNKEIDDQIKQHLLYLINSSEIVNIRSLYTMQVNDLGLSYIELYRFINNSDDLKAALDIKSNEIADMMELTAFEAVKGKKNLFPSDVRVIELILNAKGKSRGYGTPDKTVLINSQVVNSYSELSDKDRDKLINELEESEQHNNNDNDSYLSDKDIKL